MDNRTAEERSRNMSAIRSKDTKPEMLVRKFLHAQGFRYRLHWRDLPGTPDIVLPKYRTVVFVHGCFWHRHKGCPKASMPASNREYWQAKFAANVERDEKAREALEAAGWRVFVIWECELRPASRNTVLQALADKIRQQVEAPQR